MMRQALATTAFTAGVLLAGAAMAQTQAPTMQTPSASPMQQTQPTTNNAPVWHAHPRAEAHAVRVGTMYTDALNTLYAHGFHGVHHLSLQRGDVHAMAVTPNGHRRSVTVEPNTHQIQVG